MFVFAVKHNKYKIMTERHPKLPQIQVKDNCCADSFASFTYKMNALKVRSDKMFV